MDAIGSFLKTALYRVIFVLIVGIPAVEVFSFALFGNGVLIQAVDSENKTIPASVKLRFDNLSFKVPYSGYGSVPGKMGISDQGSRGNNTYPVEINIPNADVRLFKDEATLQVEDRNVIDLNGFSFKIRELHTSGWILYLTIAWVLGEILCFLGEFIIGLSFKWKFLSCSLLLEKVCPKNGAPYLRFRHFNVNEKVVEISEVHFVLGRVFAGMAFLLLIYTILNFFTYFLAAFSLFILALVIIYLACKKLLQIPRKELIIIVLAGIIGYIVYLLGKHHLIFLVLIFFSALLFFISFIYRTHANKLLYYSTRNGNNGNQPRRG